MRILLLCRYDGSGYHGFQIQSNGNTIQAEIEKALKKIHKKDVRIYMSGRTDSGVHAYMQPLHFDTELTILEAGWQKALNANLPKDIRIIGVKKVSDDFHVRYDSIEKTYQYKLYLGNDIDPFLVNYVGKEPFKFDFERAKESLKYFIGTHDFTSFCSKNGSVEDKVRTITNFTIKKEGKIVTFEITGNGFLYNMVRIIVGTVTNVALGKYEAQYIEEIFSKKSRQYAGPRADASGLYLKNVKYKNKEITDFIEEIEKNYN